MPVGPNGERLPYPGDEDYVEPPGRRKPAGPSYLPGVAQSRPGDGGPGFKTRFGGNIPSPQQMTPEQARIRALMEQLQMAGFSGEPPNQTRTPQGRRFSDIPNMTTEEIAPYNKPADDINDAFFGGTNPFDMIMKYLRGGR